MPSTLAAPLFLITLLAEKSNPPQVPVPVRNMRGPGSPVSGWRRGRKAMAGSIALGQPADTLTFGKSAASPAMRTGFFAMGSFASKRKLAQPLLSPFATKSQKR